MQSVSQENLTYFVNSFQLLQPHLIELLKAASAHDREIALDLYARTEEFFDLALEAHLRFPPEIQDAYADTIAILTRKGFIEV